MGMYKRGNVWWVNYSVDGKQHRVSTGIKNYKTAKEFYDQLIKNIENEIVNQLKPENNTGLTAVFYDRKNDQIVRNTELKFSTDCTLTRVEGYKDVFSKSDEKPCLSYNGDIYKCFYHDLVFLRFE